MSLTRPAERAVRAFAQDHRSGSAELALRACGILERFAPKEYKSAEAFHLSNHLALAVAAAQPSMAAVLNVCNRWLASVEKGELPEKAALQIARELGQGQNAAARRAASMISSGATVLTYSYSSTVLGALLESWKSGCRFHVLCSEARPLLEGRVLAQRLAKSKIPVELFTDAAFFSALGAGKLVLVGGDAILSHYFVNKVGTAALLSLARRARIPSYVVVDSSKFLPNRLEKRFQIRSQDPGEVWKPVSKSIAVHNLYFEKVRLRDCTGIVTETGVWSPTEIRGQLRGVEIAGSFWQAPDQQEQ